MQTKTREFDIAELEAVAGGMKVTPGYRSDDVIDARGGQFSFLGITFTRDIRGNLSGYGPTP